MKKLIKKGKKSKVVQETDEKQPTQRFFKKSDLGIRGKLIGCFLIPVILIIILGTVSYYKSSTESIRTYEKSVVTSFNIATSYFDTIIHDIEAKLIQLSIKNGLSKYFSGYYQDNMLEEEIVRGNEFKEIVSMQVVDKFIDNIYIFADYGKPIYTSGFMHDDFYSQFIESPEAKQFKASGKDNYYLSDHKSLDETIKLSTTHYFVSAIRSLKNIGFSDIGFVIFDIKEDCITSILEDLILEEDALYGITIRNEKELVSGTIPENFKFIDQGFYNAAVEELNQEGSNEVGYKYVKYDGEEYLYVYAKLGETEMVLNAIIPKVRMVKQMESLKQLTIALVIAAAVIAIFVGTYVSYGISKVIEMVNTKLMRASEGDLTVTVTTNRKDEFLTLTNTITTMITSVKVMVEKILGISLDVTQAAVEVTDNSGLLLRSTNEINIAVSDINGGMTQQAEDTQGCLLQMEFLSKQINSLRDNTQMIAESATETKDTVAKGIIIIDELSLKGKDTSQITLNIISEIECLEEESKSVESIIATINEISRQTNLLSLNASIEAARAGEAGKGFLVVANEIRKLASQSANASRQIKDIILQIQERTKHTVDTARKAEEIVVSQEVALGNTINVFGDINNHVEGLTERLDIIAEDLSGIENAKKDTLDAIESITATAQETSAAATMLETTAGKQLKAVEHLNGTANDLQKNVQILEEAVGLFKITDLI